MPETAAPGCSAESVGDMKEKLTVAVDGPAASGKSTVSRRVAEKTGCVYVDSGAVYRGLTWLALQKGVDIFDSRAILELPAGLDMRFFVRDNAVVFSINGVEPGAELRTAIINENVSFIAKLPEIRIWVVERLRGMTKFGCIVMEGRDIGTVVFPDAPYKFYLDASPEERAKRRYLETAGEAAAAEGVDSVKKSLSKRDTVDKTRAKDPLKPAEDAEIVDTTCMTLDQVVDHIVGKIRQSRELTDKLYT